MSLIKYRDLNFRDETKEIIVKANRIIADFGGRALTLRQVYYQFIGRDWFPSDWIDPVYNRRNGLDADTKNTIKNYQNLGKILRDGRYAGLIDWDLIEDRVRGPRKKKDWESGKSAIEQLADGFRLDRWTKQPFYIELWGEKDTLSGILNPIAEQYHCTMMINRGSSSTSAMMDSAQRIIHYSRQEHRPRPVILYVGDHDPSGVDMVRDVRKRLVEFGCPDWLDVRPIALTMAQIEKFKPPPNPVKMSDSRAASYVAKHGDASWEVEALPPDELPRIVENTLKAYIDKAAMDAVISQENQIKARLKTTALNFK